MNHPLNFPRMQRSALFLFLPLLLASCVSSSARNELHAQFPEGMYRFYCENLYNHGYAEVTHVNKGIHIQLLEKFKGSFELRPLGDKLDIARGDFSYQGLGRNFKGQGRVTGKATAEGTGAAWIGSLAVIKKDHRQGKWTLNPATPEEIAQWQRKQENLQKRRVRAGLE